MDGNHAQGRLQNLAQKLSELQKEVLKLSKVKSETEWVDKKYFSLGDLPLTELRALMADTGAPVRQGCRKKELLQHMEFLTGLPAHTLVCGTLRHRPHLREVLVTRAGQRRRQGGDGSIYFLSFQAIQVHVQNKYTGESAEVSVSDLPYFESASDLQVCRNWSETGAFIQSTAEKKGHQPLCQKYLPNNIADTSVKPCVPSRQALLAAQQEVKKNRTRVGFRRKCEQLPQEKCPDLPETAMPTTPSKRQKMVCENTPSPITAVGTTESDLFSDDSSSTPESKRVQPKPAALKASQRIGPAVYDDCFEQPPAPGAGD